jgi:Ca2+/Na+ antiporter
MTKNKSNNRLIKLPKFIIDLVICGILTVLITIFLLPLSHHDNAFFGQTTLGSFMLAFVVIGIGIYIILKIAKIIEETTSVLKDKIGIAGGLLQAVGTAFPDMIIGIVAALTAVSQTEYSEKIKFAIIAAAATFGSNIYNIGFGALCVWRQNRANHLNKPVKIFVWFGKEVIPMDKHDSIPRVKELDNANSLLTILSVLTFCAAVAMVILGKQKFVDLSFVSGDLYQLSAPAGFILIALAGLTIYKFRHNTSAETEQDEHNEFNNQSMPVILVSLLFAGAIIYFTASSMVTNVEHFSTVSGFPLFLAGALSGLVGCLGEIVVIHNFTVHPKGRLGDALVGLGMDNIVTLIGASIVAILGGVFLGGSELILIFCGVLLLNTILLTQTSILKNEYLDQKHKDE